MTHIANIPHILACGFVLPDSPKASKSYVSIGDKEVINTRWNTHVKHNLREYIPFYFGPRTPMLYVIQNGYNNVTKREPEEIVYCAVRLDVIANSDVECMFTDGHAISEFTTYYDKKDLKKVNDYVKREDVYAKYWLDSEDNDTDLKRRKEAELLIKGELPVKYVDCYVVYNEAAKQKMIAYGVKEEMIRVDVKKEMYF